MHAFRAFLLVMVILVGTSEGLFVKKLLLKKAVAVKAGFLADVKAAALKFKAGAALKKAAVVGGFKALGKAKLGVLAGIKAAKLKVLGGIAAVKFAKLAALKAAKLTFIKTLAAAKLAPFVIKKLAAKAILGKGADLVKGKDEGFGKSGNILLDGVTGLFGGGSPFGDKGADNPLGGFLGDFITGSLAGGQLPDLGGILGSLGGLSALIPQPGKPEVNIQTYNVNPAPIEYVHPPSVVSSYGVPVSSPGPTYVHPSTSYGVPQY